MKKYIFQLSILLLFSSSLVTGLHAADKPPASLRDDLVSIQGENFVIDKYLNCHLSLPLALGGGTPFNSFGMHVRFNAPAKGLISRDVFVALSMRLFTEVRIRMAAEIPGLSTEHTLRAMQCYEVAVTTEEAEYEYHISMSDKGVESRISNNQRGTDQVSHEPWRAVLINLPQR